MRIYSRVCGFNQSMQHLLNRRSPYTCFPFTNMPQRLQSDSLIAIATPANEMSSNVMPAPNVPEPLVLTSYSLSSTAALRYPPGSAGRPPLPVTTRLLLRIPCRAAQRSASKAETSRKVSGSTLYRQAAPRSLRERVNERLSRQPLEFMPGGVQE